MIRFVEQSKEPAEKSQITLSSFRFGIIGNNGFLSLGGQVLKRQNKGAEIQERLGFYQSILCSSTVF